MLRQIRIEGCIAYVPLTQGLAAIIDVEDVPLVVGFNWHAVKSLRRFYARRKQYSGGKAYNILLHRILLGAVPGIWVDHENGNGLDNRRSNLRAATVAQNMQNKGRPAHNTSGLKGVSRCKRTRKWQAKIVVAGKQHHLGRFTSPEAAHAAYCEASARLHGAFGRTE